MSSNRPEEMTAEEMSQRERQAAELLGPDGLKAIQAGASDNDEPCRIIRLTGLKSTDHYSYGQIVTLNPPPRQMAATSEFLGTIMPGRQVEHLGRAKTVKFWAHRLQPTSVFFQAVHTCFQGHHALILRPEVLMHQIVHEVATTVKMHPEDYRRLFTGNAGKTRIDVTHNGLVLGNPNSPWHEVLEMFGAKMAETVPPGIMEHLLPDFSSHTVETRAASLAAFMDAASPFYDYHTHTMCGIPEIRLAGQPEDYRLMLNAAAQLSEAFAAHLGQYFTHLLPVLTTLAQQAEGGRQDDDFWSSIYKYQSASGTATCNGWLTAFVNYIQTAEIQGSRYQTAEAGQLVQKPADVCDWRNPGEGWHAKGLPLGSVPSQVCVAPFTWHYLGTEKKMLFAGGPMAVEEQDGALMPVLSYAVLHAGE